MDVLGLCWEFQINKLHILPPTEAEVLHESLEQVLRARIAVCQWAGNDSVEYFSLLNSSPDAEELEEGVQVFNIVYDGSASQNPS